MYSRRIISILSLLLLALSVFGKSTPNLRKAVSADIEKVDIDVDTKEYLEEKEKRYLVSMIKSNKHIDILNCTFITES